MIPPTLLGISIMVFAITRLAPGGPLEQAMMQMQQVSEEGGGEGVQVQIKHFPESNWNK